MKSFRTSAVYGLAVVPLAIALVASQGSPTEQQAPAAQTFNTHVKPILQQSCTGCHRPNNAKGGLDLTTYESTMKGGVTARNVVAGKPDQSNLLRRIKGLDNKPRMPKGGSPLPATKENVIRQWILDGAKKS